VDFNRLYSDHQILVVTADRAPCAQVAGVHASAAARMAGRIASAQRELGAAAAHRWETLAAPTNSARSATGWHPPVIAS
jgi:hypothetical protein